MARAKTTLFNLITSVYHPDKGQILYNGQDITRITPDKAAQARHRPYLPDREAACAT